MVLRTPQTSAHRHAVLVVDDEPEIRTVFVDALTSGGHEATAAADGIEALRLLHDGWSPCLVLADVLMPGMNGHELRRTIEGDSALSSTEVVVVSGHAAAIHRGAMPKPMDMTDLDQLIARRCTAEMSGHPYPEKTDGGR